MRPLHFLIVAAFCVTTTCAGLGQGFVDTVDPPFWWVDMPVQQPAGHGPRRLPWLNITCSVDHPGVSVHQLLRSRATAPTIRFIYLDVAAGTAPGDLTLEWTHPNRPNRIAGKTTFSLKERKPKQAKGYSSADAICLITPDRFANGDPSNDAIEDLLEAPNRSDDHGRHGGDLAGIQQHLDYLSKMGFTAIWLNPLLENDQPQWSYHGYATTDYYRVDRRFGTNADYQALGAAARGYGLKLIMDMIMNHCGSEHPWMKDLPTKDWINNGGEFTPTTHRPDHIARPLCQPSRPHPIYRWMVCQGDAGPQPAPALARRLPHSKHPMVDRIPGTEWYSNGHLSVFRCPLHDRVDLRRESGLSPSEHLWRRVEPQPCRIGLLAKGKGQR